MAEPPAAGNAQEPTEEWLAANQRHLVAALDVIRCRLATADDDTIAEAQRHRDELREAMPGPPALERIAERLDLSEFEREVLLMCAGAELDTAFAHACAGAQGDPARTYGTFALGLICPARTGAPPPRQRRCAVGGW